MILEESGISPEESHRQQAHYKRRNGLASHAFIDHSTQPNTIPAILGFKLKIFGLQLCPTEQPLGRFASPVGSPKEGASRC
eukprot:scaffold413_cov176-Ochromonas_danica.AAC.13